MDDNHSPSYRFDATNVPRQVANDLLAFRRYNKLDNRDIVEFAHDIVIDDCGFPIANRVFAVALRRLDPDDRTGVHKGVAVA